VKVEPVVFLWGDRSKANPDQKKSTGRLPIRKTTGGWTAEGTKGKKKLGALPDAAVTEGTKKRIQENKKRILTYPPQRKRG